MRTWDWVNRQRIRIHPIKYSHENIELLQAVKQGNQINSAVMLERGANANTQTEDGWSVLFWAVHLKRVEIARGLLSAGANPNCRLPVMRATALIEATRNLDNKMVSMLLDYGANVNDRDFLGYTALAYAVLAGDIGVVTDLMNHGANPLIKSKDGNSPIGLARGRNNSEVDRLFARYIG